MMIIITMKILVNEFFIIFIRIYLERYFETNVAIPERSITSGDSYIEIIVETIKYVLNKLISPQGNILVFVSGIKIIHQISQRLLNIKPEILKDFEIVKFHSQLMDKDNAVYDFKSITRKVVSFKLILKNNI